MMFGLDTALSVARSNAGPTNAENPIVFKKLRRECFMLLACSCGVRAPIVNKAPLFTIGALTPYVHLVCWMLTIVPFIVETNTPRFVIAMPSSTGGAGSWHNAILAPSLRDAIQKTPGP